VIKVVGNNHPALLNWVAEHIDHLPTNPFDPSSTRCVALLQDDCTPVAVLALDTWSANGVEGSFATDGSKRWAQREFIQACYGYVFDVCGKHRLTMVTAVENDAMNRLHTALGHTNEGRLRDWFMEDEDAFVWSFTRRDWQASRWHPSRRPRTVNRTDFHEGTVYGQECTSSAAST
jgi:hypothetical protein